MPPFSVSVVARIGDREFLTTLHLQPPTGRMDPLSSLELHDQKPTPFEKDEMVIFEAEKMEGFRKNLVLEVVDFHESCVFLIMCLYIYIYLILLNKC